MFPSFTNAKWALNWKKCELFVSLYTDKFSGYFFQSYVSENYINPATTGLDRCW